MKNQIKYIVIHCSDVSERSIFDQLKSINEYHRDVKMFPKSSLNYWVGYHYLITGNTIYQCRADGDVGSHCNQGYDGIKVYPPGSGLALSMNYQSCGICWGGDGDIEFPSPKHYELLQKKVWEVQDKYKIPNERVFFHRKFSISKTCPGSLITDQWLKDLLTRPKVIPETPKTDSCLSVIIEKDKQISRLQELVQSIINFFRK